LGFIFSTKKESPEVLAAPVAGTKRALSCQFHNAGEGAPGNDILRKEFAIDFCIFDRATKNEKNL
jgi:hypothetical protein